MLTTKKIGVLMGGTSAEREVSLRSGSAVLNALKLLGYDAVSIDAQDNVCEIISEENIAVAFLALHGGWGEDGGIQGLLEVMGIPYTGSGVLASALAMDKIASKIMFSAHGIAVPQYEVLYEMKMPSLNLPLVVKPAKEGSSIGVSIVREKDRLEDALRVGFSFGAPVLLEQYIEGKEVQIGILNERALGGVEVRPSLEFYSYEAKYTSGLTEYLIPPELDAKTYEAVKQAAIRAHRALGCSGATRVDLIVDRLNRPYVLEVNTIPGMTETSLLPKIAKAAGLSFTALVEEILKDALSRKKK